LNPFNIGDITIPIPIIQGGMGIGISLSGLAAAVANLGGVGIISSVGIGLIDYNPDFSYRENNIYAIRKEIRRAREKSKGVLGVNIMSAITNFSDMVKTSIDEGIDIIFSGAGLPLDLPKYLSDGVKTKLVPIVSSARAASIILNKWHQNFNKLPDAFVVEGPKAGGHLGFKRDQLEDAENTLENLVSEVLSVTKEAEEKYKSKIPVIAAGGIYSGADAYKFFRMGAAAVQLGTRFVATEECDASETFKNMFVDADESDIKIINSPVGMPGRTINNEFITDSIAGEKKPEFCKHHCIRSCKFKEVDFCISEALVAAYRGDMKNGFAFTGSNVGKVHEISTVKDVFNDFLNEYQIEKEKNNG
jgi:nitronate monooxygenase